MENDNKSGLRISQIISVLSMLVILFTSTQLFVSNQSNTNTNLLQAKLTNEEEIEELVKLEENSQVEVATATETFRRTDNTTSRGNIERTAIEETKYISVEEIKISKDMDLTVRCGISREDFIKLMENMKADYSGFFGENAGAIYDLCEKYEINEIFFCGLIAAESGWKITKNHRNTNNFISMMSGGKLIKFNSPEDGLEAAAKLLHTRYLTEGGSYYYGKTLSCVQKRFCPNSTTWVGLVYGCMNVIV